MGVWVWMLSVGTGVGFYFFDRFVYYFLCFSRFKTSNLISSLSLAFYSVTALICSSYLFSSSSALS